MTKKKQNPSARIIRFLFSQWKVSPWLVALMIVAQIIAVTIGAAIAPLFISKLLAGISSGKASLDNSVWLLIGYGVTLFIGEVVMYRIALIAGYLSESKMQAKVNMDIFEHLNSKSLTFHSNRISGGVVSDANKLTGSIERFWDTVIWDVIPIVATIISITIALSFILWQYAVILALLVIIITLIIVWSQTKIAPISKRLAKRSSDITARLSDVIGNISAVKAYAQEKSEQKHFKKIVDNWRKAEIDEMKSVAIITSVFGTMMTIMNIAAFTAAIIATQYHIGNVGILYLVIAYTISVTQQLWQVGSSTRSYSRIVGDAGPMLDTMDSEIELKDPETPEVSLICNGKIEFENITFTHPENHDSLFKDFSITINAGERVGLVGSSGSGKTSFARLLLRFTDVDNGSVKIDGQDIRKITQSDLHKAIAYVPQEPALFHRSLRENIAYGKPNATEAEIKNAAIRANATEFIETTKDGFDTLVGERGIKLSGGQRQRVAIARAILLDAPILVLDEATSALDSETEALIQDALSKLINGRTSIVIAHRLSTIANLDRVIVLEDGKIVEQGTHNELVRKGGEYAKLWTRQSGGFIKE